MIAAALEPRPPESGIVRGDSELERDPADAELEGAHDEILRSAGNGRSL